jgi:hypothetical protein
MKWTKADLEAAMQKEPVSSPPAEGHPDPMWTHCGVPMIYIGTFDVWITVNGPDPSATIDEHEMYAGGQKIIDYQIRAPYAKWICPMCQYEETDGY